MRITIVSRIYAPEPSAASQRLLTLATALRNAGDRMRVLTTRPPRGVEVTTEPGVRVSRWPVLRDRSGYVRGYLPYLSFDVPAFFRVLFSRRSDVVVVEPPPTTGAFMRVACAVRRMPYVYYAADIWSLAAESTGAPAMIVAFVRMLEAFALRGAARVLAVSDGVADEVRRLAPRARVEVVGHGVDETVYRPIDRDEPSRFDAVYVGTASEWHGATVFTEALRILADRDTRPRVAFIGQGVDWDRMQRSVDEYGLADAVTFRGAIDAHAAAAVLREARVALASVRPGIGYDFAVPTKMYSALAVGTPVVFAGPAALVDLVRENDLGWGCEPDAEAVADAIGQAVASEPLPDARRAVATWAAENVGARAVAARAVEAVHAAARYARHPAS